MKLKSLGYRTDLIFTKLDGEVTDRGNYLVVKTLSNPDFYWGNLLIFEAAPKSGDLEIWKKLFKQEFPGPETKHITLAWDEESTGEMSDFTQAGFKLEKGVVLSASKDSLTKPKKFNHQISIIHPQTESEWDEIAAIQLLTKQSDIPDEELKIFYCNQIARYQRLISLNQGKWFCAKLGDKIVGSLGIFSDHELGRFQIVTVHPEYQRQGVCGALVYEAALHAFTEMKLTTLVMIADEEYHAADIYKSVGFSKTEQIYGVCKY